MGKVTSCESFFGFKPGADKKIARWDKIVEYFHLLTKESDRILVENMGPSTEGNDFLKVIITSPDNIKNIEEIRKTSMKIADPRGLSEDEIDSLVKAGKSVCVQSMSLHASEIGGTQMAIQLAHGLVSCDCEDTVRILDNVVFIMVPCFNPDGQIMVTDHYNSTIDTAYEGSNYPKLYHLYAGHDNNRDAFAQNLIESYYMAQILFHQWMPQAFQDHHHMGPYGARIQLAPYKNPIRPYVDPLTWRELNLYGASMAYHMESQGLDGVSSGAQYPGWGHFGFHWLTNSHNIAGMLTESASAKLATPRYIHHSQLKGDGDIVQPKYEAQTNFPNPWKGGWWRLSDIVERKYHASYALLDAMAKNREQILRNMAQKALNQSKAGENNETFAFIIPKQQHDMGTAKKLIEILLAQGIEVHTAKSEFRVENRIYDAGTKVVFLSQPKYGVIMVLLAKTRHPDNQWTRDASNAHTAFDMASDTVFEYMGVKVHPANAKFEGDFEKVTELPANLKTVSAAKGYVLSAKENNSFHTVNLLLKAGVKVFRVEACPWKDFYVECSEDKMNEILEKAPTAVTEFNDKIEERSKLTEIKPSKVAMYQRFYMGNADEGWTRLIFEKRDFDYTTVFDKDIVEGKLSEFDVLILPSDFPGMLTGPATIPDSDPRKQLFLRFIGDMPPEYQSGLGKDGAAAIKKFVEEGGKLLTFNLSCDYAIDILNLPVINLIKDLPLTKFNTKGSTLHVNVDNSHPAAYGMPERALIMNLNSPVFEPKIQPNSDNCQVILEYPTDNILESGLLTGEEILKNKAAAMSVKYNKGEVVLYGLSPQWRAQTHGTFKLLFNMLYSELN